MTAFNRRYIQSVKMEDLYWSCIRCWIQLNNKTYNILPPKTCHRVLKKLFGMLVNLEKNRLNMQSKSLIKILLFNSKFSHILYKYRTIFGKSKLNILSNNSWFIERKIVIHLPTKESLLYKNKIYLANICKLSILFVLPYVGQIILIQQFMFIWYHLIYWPPSIVTFRNDCIQR